MAMSHNAREVGNQIRGALDALSLMEDPDLIEALKHIYDPPEGDSLVDAALRGEEVYLPGRDSAFGALTRAFMSDIEALYEGDDETAPTLRLLKVISEVAAAGGGMKLGLGPEELSNPRCVQQPTHQPHNAVIPSGSLAWSALITTQKYMRLSNRETS